MMRDETIAPAGEITVLGNQTELAAAVADHFVRASREAIAARGKFLVSLAGGTTPKQAYALLATDPRMSMIDWSCVEVYFGDERCVGPQSADSNYRMARETFLDRVALLPNHVHRMQGEEKPTVAAHRYADILRNHVGEAPIFDLVLLGLGPDAHTASWFPGVQISEDALVQAPFIPKLGVHRLTLGPCVVNKARDIIVSASGSEKAEALAAVFGQDRDVMRFPAQRLAPQNGTLRWFIDHAAARLLPKELT